MNSFLNKAFNVEYVYLMLTGIVRIMHAQNQKFQQIKTIQHKINMLEKISMSQQGLGLRTFNQNSVVQNSQVLDCESQGGRSSKLLAEFFRKESIDTDIKDKLVSHALNLNQTRGRSK